jgi:hypothetical protein
MQGQSVAGWKAGVIPQLRKQHISNTVALAGQEGAVTGIDFSQLSSLSRKLNEASDTLSTQITAFESALNELKLGVSAWVVVARWQTDSPWTVDGVVQGTMEEVESIGYGKRKGKWGLLYSLTYPEIGDPDFDSEMPLRDAPRIERIRAIDKLPDLVRELESKASALANEAAEKANQVALLVSQAKVTQK